MTRKMIKLLDEIDDQLYITNLSVTVIDPIGIGVATFAARSPIRTVENTVHLIWNGDATADNLKVIIENDQDEYGELWRTIHSCIEEVLV